MIAGAAVVSRAVLATSKLEVFELFRDHGLTLVPQLA
jgi:hypothetical protein